MNTSKAETRLERTTNELADFAENKAKEAGKAIIGTFIDEAKTWLMNFYEKWKRSRSLKPKYEELQKYIETTNEITQIGMEKKELAIMWAMEKLGYTEEKIQEVLELADKAYLPKEER